MTIAIALIEHALLHIALLDLARDVLAVGHGDDAADQDVERPRAMATTSRMNEEACS